MSYIDQYFTFHENLQVGIAKASLLKYLKKIIISLIKVEREKSPGRRGQDIRSPNPLFLQFVKYILYIGVVLYVYIYIYI